MVSRAERSLMADWWWTVDRWLLAAFCTLVIAGLVLTMAGSPPVAERLNLPTFHFVNRQVMSLDPGARRDVRDVVPVAASRPPRRAPAVSWPRWG